jgi:hypothetical protein
VTAASLRHFWAFFLQNKSVLFIPPFTLYCAQGPVPSAGHICEQMIPCLHGVLTQWRGDRCGSPLPAERVGMRVLAFACSSVYLCKAHRHWFQGVV